MTNEEILAKALEKAVQNGWSGIDLAYANNGTEGKTQDPREIADGLNTISSEYGISGINDIIFSHEFAKAFWGEEELYIVGLEPAEEWKIRLQEMVLEEDHIQYLKQFL